MIDEDESSFFSRLPKNLSKFSAIGIGCGLGQEAATVSCFADLLKQTKIPLVIDADALNILSQNVHLQDFIPKNSILTPHIGEFQRLCGKWRNDEEKIEKAAKFAFKKGVFLLLKGANSMIFSPEKEIFINSTGNAGMAKAGSGDVLTGLITGLCARGYSPKEAVIAGAFFHGKSGDKATQTFGYESYNSKNLIDFIKIAAVT
jgi:NAD(P)H-hydrate epimerase